MMILLDKVKARLKMISMFQGTQVLLVVTLVLVSYVIFMFVLRVAIPIGDPEALSLHQLLTGFSQNRSNGLFTKERSDLLQTGFHNRVAVLTYLQKDVKNKRAESIVWDDARKDMNLYERDAIQTLRNSKAVISFDNHNFLDVGENSLVVIKRLLESRAGEAQVSSLILESGILKGRLQSSDNKKVLLEITLPLATTKVRVGQKGRDQAAFEISVETDRRSNITVYQGKAEIESGDKAVELQENHLAVVSSEGEISRPESLLGEVFLLQPREGAILTQDDPQASTFQWGRIPGQVRYLLEVAKDPYFRDLVLSQMVDATSFKDVRLTPGVYVWRVGAVDSSGRRGAYGEIRTFRVMRSTTAPSLRILNPQGEHITVETETLVISGMTDPGAVLTINGQTVGVNADGRFSQKILLNSGMNLIVIQASDRSGNVRQESKFIYHKFWGGR
jgi:hypothetical protein